MASGRQHGGPTLVSVQTLTVHSETKAVLCFFFFKREVLAWGGLLANRRSSEVQVLLPR